jgi:hypothetical protein
MEDNEPFGVPESGSSKTAKTIQPDRCDPFGIRKKSFIENGDHMTTFRPDTGFITPKAGIEQRETLLLETIVSLDALTPPFTEVMAVSKFPEVVFVFICPPGESEVIGIRRDPTLPGTDQEFTFFGDANTGVGAVDLLGNNHVPVETGDFTK